MHIQCPSCGFERDVPEENLQPGKKYKVTCPKCTAIFHFVMPEKMRGDLPEDVPGEERKGEAPSPETVAPVHTATHTPTEQDADDPLPPGASIPTFHHEGNESAPQTEPKDEVNNEEQPRNIWERWRVNREHVRAYDEGQDEEKNVEGRPQGAPWESPEYYGFWGSFSRTLLGVLFHAPDFFRNLRCAFSPVRPLLFYVLLSLYQMLAARLWNLRALRELSQTAADPQMLAMAENLMRAMNLPLMLLVTPFFSIFQAVILAGLYHLMFRMVQPDRADFSTTLRVVCYSSAPLVLCIVPMIGSLIAVLWFVAATVIGCKYALRLSWSRTLLALLPLYILELAFVSQIPAFMNTGT